MGKQDFNLNPLDPHHRSRRSVPLFAHFVSVAAAAPSSQSRLGRGGMGGLPEPLLHLFQAPGGAEDAAPVLVQLIDEHGAYSTARLVPDAAAAAERSSKRAPGSLRDSSESREGLLRRFSCGACGKAFKRAWELLSHEVVHTAARPFRCGLCAAAFKRHSDCKSHRLVHSDERPHRCDACGKRFKRASNLQVRGRGEAGPAGNGRGWAGHGEVGRVWREGWGLRGKGGGPAVGPALNGGVALSATRVSGAFGLEVPGVDGERQSSLQREMWLGWKGMGAGWQRWG